MTAATCSTTTAESGTHGLTSWARETKSSGELMKDGRQRSDFSPTVESRVWEKVRKTTKILLELDGSCRRRTKLARIPSGSRGCRCVVPCHKEPLSHKLSSQQWRRLLVLLNVTFQRFAKRRATTVFERTGPNSVLLNMTGVPIPVPR